MATLRDKITGILEGGHIKSKALDKIMEEIYKEHERLRPALRWFSEEMEDDLRKNEFKGGWLDGEYNYYWGKALKHILELRPIDAVKVGRKKYSIGQCAKASNYLMMFAHNLMEELRNEEEGVK